MEAPFAWLIVEMAGGVAITPGRILQRVTDQALTDHRGMPRNSKWERQTLQKNKKYICLIEWPRYGEKQGVFTVLKLQIPH